MGRSLERRTTYALGLFLMISWVAPARAQTGLDQFQLDASGANQAIHSTRAVGQTFTVGASGLLSGLEVSVFETTSGADLAVSILDLSGGDILTAPTLGSVFLSESDLRASTEHLSTEFVSSTLVDLRSLGISVTSGDVLAFLLTTNRVLPDLFAVKHGTVTGSYPGGSTFTIQSGSLLMGGADVGFKTFVGAITQEPGVLYEVDATVTSSHNFGGHYPADVGVGSPVTVRFELFSSSLPDTDPTPGLGAYSAPSSAIFTIAIGASFFATGTGFGGTLTVCDGTADQFCGGGSPGDGVTLGRNLEGEILHFAQVSLTGPSSVLASDAHGPDLPLLAWDEMVVVHQKSPGPSTMIAEIDSIRVVPRLRVVRSPVVGDFRVTGVENPNCNNATGLWTFCQHQTGFHRAGGGISGSDDTHAWDLNLAGNLDAGMTVHPVAAGTVVPYAGQVLPMGNDSGAVLVEHAPPGVDCATEPESCWWSGYLHMENIGVSEGERVGSADALGEIGGVSPFSIPDHLHLAVYVGENLPGLLQSVDASFVPEPTAPSAFGSALLALALLRYRAKWRADRGRMA